MNVRECYAHALTQRGFQPDVAQQKAVDELQKIYDAWTAYGTQRARLARLLTRPFHRTLPSSGLYMWGGVGRCKSFLMDNKKTETPNKHKTRVHFHEFMRSVHRELDSLK